MAGTAATVSVLGLIVFGTLASLLGKIVYELSGNDFHGDEKLFRKPWATTTFMFFGMSFCLPIGWVYDYLQRRKQSSEKQSDTEPLLTPEQGAHGADGANGANGLAGTAAEDSSSSNKHSSLRNTLLLAVPTMFDLTATVLMSIGLLFVTASVYQMLRGAEMLFAAIFSVVFLKRTLNRNNYIGIGCCLAGICAVGISSVLSGQGSASAETTQAQILLGMALIVCSQGVQAAQVTVEDYVMSDIGTAPLQVVGYEGVFGCLAMFCVLLPLVQHTPGQDGSGLHEDSWETWHLITHSSSLPYMVPALVLSLLCYNIAGMFVTDEIGAVARTVLETMRTLFVWMVDLLLYYTPLGLGRLGEKWDNYSYLQAVGFVVLVVGTVVYGRGDDQHVEAHKATLHSEHPHLRWRGALQKIQDLHRPVHRSTFGIASMARSAVLISRHAKAAVAHTAAMREADASA
ncbi:hypothetical protein ABBQ38_005161 [Trebouxia sp. C0009 RCD-2024]